MREWLLSESAMVRRKRAKEKLGTVKKIHHGKTGK